MAEMKFKFVRLQTPGGYTAYQAEVTGAIEATTIGQFQRIMGVLIDKGIRNLILDMRRVTYINSTGLGSLLKYSDHFRNIDGKFIVTQVPDRVRMTMQMLGLDAAIEICENEMEALERIEPPAEAAAPVAGTEFEIVSPDETAVEADAVVEEEVQAESVALEEVARQAEAVAQVAETPAAEAPPVERETGTDSRAEVLQAIPVDLVTEEEAGEPGEPGETETVVSGQDLTDTQRNHALRRILYDMTVLARSVLALTDDLGRVGGFALKETCRSAALMRCRTLSDFLTNQLPSSVAYSESAMDAAVMIDFGFAARPGLDESVRTRVDRVAGHITNQRMASFSDKEVRKLAAPVLSECIGFVQDAVSSGKATITGKAEELRQVLCNLLPRLDLPPLDVEAGGDK